MQKEEAEKFTQLQEERASLETQLLLWKLFHIEQGSDSLRKSLKELEKEAGTQETKRVRPPSESGFLSLKITMK